MDLDRVIFFNETMPIQLLTKAAQAKEEQHVQLKERKLQLVPNLTIGQVAGLGNVHGGEL